MVFECAALAVESAIVSGDKNLLTIKACNGIRVLAPREFSHLHGSQSLGPSVP
jgi:predicted nucleic acid-binding protein